MCGSPANTGEHKIKRNLLVTLHGRGPYRNEKELTHFRDGEESRLRGPNAKQIKFQNVLCAPCNNSKTQAFDLAYDQFCNYVLNAEKLITQRRVIDFADVYGDSFEDSQRNLYKYFAKLFGCDLAANRLSVPEDVRALIAPSYFLTKFRVTFAVNEDKLILPPSDRPTGFDELLTNMENLKTRADPNPWYQWGLFFSFLHIGLWYDCVPAAPVGACWTANSRYIYLGHFAPLSEEMREKLRQKAAERWNAT